MRHRCEDTVNVTPPVGADLNLELAVTALAQVFHLSLHRLRCRLRRNAIHRRPVGKLAAKQHPQGLTCRLAENIPARHIDR